MKILVVAPMQREYSNFNAALEGFQTLKNDYTVIHAEVGKVNAAASVSKTLAFQTEKGPAGMFDLVAIIGYAAGSRDFKQGDFVAPNKVCYHDARVPKGLIPELDAVYKVEGDNDITVLTGDSFVDASLAEKLEQQFGSKAIYDMEAAAVCQICAKYGLPVVVLKMISDVPQNQHTVQSFEEFVNSHTDFGNFVEYLEMKTVQKESEFIEFIKRHCITMDFPKKGITFIDIFPLMQKNFPADMEDSGIKPESVIFVPEARGFLFYSWCKQFGSVIPCRKSGKLPGELLEVSYEKEYGSDKLFFQKRALENAVLAAPDKGDTVNVSIFDDLLATGGTMAALIKAINAMKIEVGGRSYSLNVKSVGCYIELTDLPGRALLENMGVEVHTAYKLDTEKLAI